MTEEERRSFEQLRLTVLQMHVNAEAQRLVVTAALQASASIPGFPAAFKGHLKEAVEITTGVALGSPAPDEYIEQVEDALRRITPAELRP